MLEDVFIPHFITLSHTCLDAFVDIFSWNLQMEAVIETFERQGDQLLMFLLDFKLHICLNVISVGIL